MEVVANVTAARQFQEVGGVDEPIDRGYLARVTLGNRVLEREVLELFAGQLLVYVAQLRAADSEKDWKFLAHTIKGSALAVGANKLANLAHMAERLDLDTEPADLERLRRQAAVGVAAASEEACHYIACLFATA